MRKFTLNKKEQKEGFYVTINYMHGDADEYTDETYGPFPNEKVLDDFLDCVLSASGRGKPTKNTYWDTYGSKNVPSSKKSFLSQDFVNEIDYHPANDCFDCDSLARFDGIAVEYVDKNGTVFDVDWQD